jgi:hypothetical protein
MAVMTKKVCLGWGVGGLVLSVCALAATGCSDSSAGPSAGDASLDAPVEAAGPTPPLGVPVSSCAGCPVCGGVLGSATKGITYCTQDCTTNTDCPSGTGCVVNTTSPGLLNECLKTCTSDSDCTPFDNADTGAPPFICRSDLGSPGNFCWSPFPPPMGPAVDAGDAAAPEEAGPVDAGTPPIDTGAPPSDSGGTDAALSDAADAAAGD